MKKGTQVRVKAGGHRGRIGTVRALFATVDIDLPETPEPIAFDVDHLEVYDPADKLIAGWAREAEIRDYAKAFDCSLTEAVHRLVNHGLSHR
jgi:hypothetical protein